MSISTDFLTPDLGYLFFSLVIASDISNGSECSSIDFAFQCAAWPLILLEEHCKLWGKGSLLAFLTFRVSAAACLGVDELSQGSVTTTSSARGYDLPTFLRSSDGCLGSGMLGAH